MICLDDINIIFEKLLLENEKKIITEYKGICNVKRNEAKKFENGRFEEFLIQPFFYSLEHINNYMIFCDKMTKIINKFIENFLTNKYIQQFYNYEDEILKLIFIDFKYKNYVPKIRYDIFYIDNKNYKLCEINTDGSSGMKADTIINEILLNSLLLKKLSNTYHLYYMNTVESWINESLKIYDQYYRYNQNINKKPVIGIVHGGGSNDFEETEMFSKCYVDKGCDAAIINYKDLVYKNNCMYYENKKIDLLYKEAQTEKLIKSPTECMNLLEAMKNGENCILGNGKSLIVSDKAFFAALYDENIINIFNNEEKQFIQKYVPYTKKFEGDKSLYNEVLKNKDKYIIKERDTYASLGVYIGKNYNYSAWKKIVYNHWQNNSIIQEFVDTIKYPLFNIKNDGIKNEEFNAIIGLFSYNNIFSGFFTKICKDILVKSYTNDAYYVGNIIVGGIK